MRPERAWLVVLVLACGLVSACASGSRRSSSEAASDRAASPAEIQVALGQAYLRQGMLDVAMEKLERALELDPRSANAHTVIAVLYQRIGDDERARDHYARAVALAPRSGDALNNYGTFLCGNREFAEAELLFDRALKDPFYRTPAVALANRGSCQVKAGQLDAADASLRRALEIDPRSAEALYSMASLALSRQDHLRARAFIERYLAAAPVSVDALRMAADIESRLGNTRGANEYRARIAREFPDASPAPNQGGGSP